jgi:hypothetical protein
MSQFLVEDSLSGIVSQSMSVPQVELPARSGGIPLAQFQLAPGQILTMPYLSLHFIAYRTLGFSGRVNSSLPIVYVGLYYETQVAQDNVLARPILLTGCDIPSVSVMRRNISATFTAPGLYRVQLVNNHASSTIAALVLGAGQIFNAVANG